MDKSKLTHLFSNAEALTANFDGRLQLQQVGLRHANFFRHQTDAANFILRELDLLPRPEQKRRNALRLTSPTSHQDKLVMQALKGATHLPSLTDNSLSMISSTWLMSWRRGWQVIVHVSPKTRCCDVQRMNVAPPKLHVDLISVPSYCRLLNEAGLPAGCPRRCAF